MSDTPTVYRAIDSVLSIRERADLVLSFCFEGDVARARRLLVACDDADSLLARGVVTYWLARTENGFSYETAKDELTKASRLFSERQEKDRSLLADIWVGLCYWRQGQSDEGMVLMRRASRASDQRVQFLALVNISVLETETGDWPSALATLGRAQPYFGSETSVSWQGKFFHQRGLAYKQAYEATGKLDYLDRALIDYEAASERYEHAGNLRFEASISNNLANLYRIAGQFKKAHYYVDRAEALYKRVVDRSNLAQTKDTKALILLDEGRHALAKGYADKAVLLLEGRDPAWLITPLVTRARILCRLGQCSSSKDDLERAIAIAESVEDNNKAAELYLEKADILFGYLSAGALADIFDRINQLSPSRLSAVAGRVIRAVSSPELKSIKDLRCAERKIEHEVILRALENADGSVTRAAKALGKTNHSGLIHIIKTRHPDLLQYCRPIKKRGKSVKSSGR